MFAPLFLVALAEVYRVLSLRPEVYEGERLWTPAICTVVAVGFWELMKRFGRGRVRVFENGIDFRLAPAMGGHGFVRWSEIESYRFEQVARRRGRARVIATVRTRARRSFSVDSAFSELRGFGETVVEHVDWRRVPELTQRLRSGESVAFGEVVLGPGWIELPERGRLSAQRVSALEARDGELELCVAGEVLRVPAVPNVYALQAVWERLHPQAEKRAIQ